MEKIQKWVACVLLGALPIVLPAQTAESVKEHTEFLASDELGGRAAGSDGIKKAAEYIRDQFQSMELRPWDGKSFYQSFDCPGQEAEVNVVGVIRAKTPSKRSIVFTAHYDAVGPPKAFKGKDSIFNGAQDNAIGVGALIELARRFSLEKAPEHHLVFVATAAEEIGLYGSAHYLNHPVFPKEEIILCLNIDGFNVSGPREDYFVFPKQGVNFIEKVEAVLQPHGWSYVSPQWENKLNTNFDTAVFLRNGIPAMTIWTGNRLKGGEITEPLKLGAIHSPADEITELWNWGGIEDHVLLYKTLADYFLKNPEGLAVTNPELFDEK